MNIKSKIILLGAALTSVATAQNMSDSKQMASAMDSKHQQERFMEWQPELDFIEMERNSHPGDKVYGGIWSNTNINPYEAKRPDTFTVNCSKFEAPIESRVTSEYGPRWGRFHAGIDIALKKGDSVRCAFDGQVRIGQKFNKDGYGWYVVIRHDNGLETLYGHLSRPLVCNDQKVKAGDVIGLGGSTGRSTGPHLHFETRFLGIPMNPRNIIDFENNVIFRDYYTIKKHETFAEWDEFHNIYNPYNRRRGRKVRKNPLMEALAQSEILMEVYADQPEIAEATPEEIALFEKATRRVNYRVKKGDNLSSIASRYGTTIEHICATNHIRRNATLSLGQKLVIIKGAK